MDYVATLRFRPAASSADRDAALMRRASWQYPEGIRVIAEYWPTASTLSVVTIFSTDDYNRVLEVIFEWNDVFDIDVHPAMSAEDGLRILPGILGRLPRFQPQ